MLAKQQKIAVIFIVATVLLASGIYILLNLPPEPPELTPAEQMILQPSDIGPGWQSSVASQYNMDQVNETSIRYANLDNGTIGLILRIDVFNSTNDSHNAFIGFRSGLFPLNYENISLGDEAVFFAQETWLSSLPGVILVRGNVTAIVQTQSFTGNTWQKNATLDMAQLQLDKIDQYLAQHPGAS
jgi:hypothetical protein